MSPKNFRRDLLPWRRPQRDTLRGLGLNLAELTADASTADRQKTIRWVEGIQTRNGTSRAQRVANCGALHVGKYKSGLWGFDHAYCRDRACPRCMHHRQSKLSDAARLKVDHACEAGADVDFFTLTQAKLPHESADDAIERMMGCWRRLITMSCSQGRLLRLAICGGMRSLESVRSSAGTKRRDGSVVAETAWHVHMHGLMEHAPFSTAALYEIVDALADELLRLGRRRDIAVVPGIADHITAKIRKVNAVLRVAREETWRELGRELFLWVWLDQNAEASRYAQDIQDADADRAGQVCKYVTKPFELKDDALGRELFLALDSRKVVNGWGSWLKWIGDALEEKDDTESAMPFQIAQTRLSTVVDHARLGHPRVVVSLGPVKMEVDPTTILADIAKRPRSRHALLRDMMHREAPSGSEERRKRSWLVERWMLARIEAEAYLDRKEIPQGPLPAHGFGA